MTTAAPAKSNMTLSAPSRSDDLAGVGHDRPPRFGHSLDDAECRGHHIGIEAPAGVPNQLDSRQVAGPAELLTGRLHDVVYIGDAHDAGAHGDLVPAEP